MQRALILGLTVMVFGGAVSEAALAQATKQTAPGAITSASTAMALPTGGSAAQGGQAGQSQTAQRMQAAFPANNGVAQGNSVTADKAGN